MRRALPPKMASPSAGNIGKERQNTVDAMVQYAVTEDGFELLTPWPDGTGSYEAP